MNLTAHERSFVAIHPLPHARDADFWNDGTSDIDLSMWALRNLVAVLNSLHIQGIRLRKPPLRRDFSRHPLKSCESVRGQ